MYEGRYSGDDDFPAHDPTGELMVNAAHVGGFNAGNIGVALLGDFTTRLPTAAPRRTLVRVLAVPRLDTASTAGFGRLRQPHQRRDQVHPRRVGPSRLARHPVPRHLFAPELDGIRANVAECPWPAPSSPESAVFNRPDDQEDPGRARPGSRRVKARDKAEDVSPRGKLRESRMSALPDPRTALPLFAGSHVAAASTTTCRLMGGDGIGSSHGEVVDADRTLASPGGFARDGEDPRIAPVEPLID